MSTQHTLLLIEDCSDISEALQDLLSDEGFLLHVAPDGRKGLELLHSLSPPPLAVLLDLMLPGTVSGWEVLACKRVDPRIAQVPVVVLSAVSPLIARSRNLEGATVFLHKPFRLEELLSVLRCFRRNDESTINHEPTVASQR